MTMIPFKSSTMIALALVALQVLNMPEVVDAAHRAPRDGEGFDCVSRKKQTRVAPRTAIYTYMYTRPINFYDDSARFVGLRVRRIHGGIDCSAPRRPTGSAFDFVGLHGRCIRCHVQLPNFLWYIVCCK